jgi:SpoVK/Ycf46/Vps4 family AAA+-type ATPase
MRYFKVDVFTNQEPESDADIVFGEEKRSDQEIDERHTWGTRGFWRYTDDLNPLYGELGKEAIIRIIQTSSGFGFNEGYIAVVLMNPRASEQDAREFALRALGVWGIFLPEGARIQVAETTFFEGIMESRYHFAGASSRYIQAGLYELEELCSGKRKLLQESLDDKPVGLDEALGVADATAHRESLGTELHRIFTDATSGAPTQLPVDYLVEGQDEREAERVVDVLVSALRSSGRVASPHVFRFDCDCVNVSELRVKVDSVYDLLNDALSESLRGNVVVVTYGRFDEGGSYDQASLRFFSDLTSQLARICDTTQVIFVAPAGKPDVRRRMRSALPMPMVELDLDPVPSVQDDREATLAYLRRRAEQDGVEPNGSLEQVLDRRMQDKSLTDPDRIYREWRLRESVGQDCPAYAAEVERYFAEGEATHRTALQELDELIGLDAVKREIREVLLSQRISREAAAKGLPAQRPSLHLAFEGSPGTGKTEVARLYGEILKEQGMLKEGRIISVSGGQVSTMDFERAIGSVLFIDEAYAMLPFGPVSELIAFMENHREDTVVILAGYQAHVEALINSNPGFRSRLGGIIVFPDYTVDELVDIFRLMCRRAELEVPQETVDAVHDLVSRGGRRADQGNGRYVRNIFEKAVRAQHVRLAEENPEGSIPVESLRTLLPQDLLTHEEAQLLAEPHESAREELEGLIGLSDVKRIVSQWLDLARIEKVRARRGLATSPLPMHMAFLGNPGTGKTEVARLVGRILHEEGVLSVGNLFECGKQDLVSPLSGVSAARIASLFQEARGSVIFIDEAYTLVEHPQGAGAEAIDALIDQMEKTRDEVVVILAGYTRQMEELLAQNPGFASRVPTRITFPDYTEDELVEILGHMARKQGLELEDGVADKVRRAIRAAKADEDFGNARFVRNLLDEARLAQSERIARSVAGMSVDEAAADQDAVSDGELRLIRACDVPEHLHVHTSTAKRRPIGFAAA